MTIRLLSQYQDYPTNTIVTLPPDREAYLVNIGAASTTLTGGTPYVPPVVPNQVVPASLVTDPAGNVLGIQGAGGKTLTLGSSNPRLPYAKGFDIFDAYRVTDRRQLSLPNPYSAVGPDMVHPSVVYVATGWNGWRFWMAYTPYPTANSDYENPCVAVSQDGEVWEAPSGLVNPLVGKPANGFNADTQLFLSPDNKTMYMVFRERISGANNRVKVMQSTDGVSWSAPVTVLAGARGTQDYASPSIFYDVANTRWVMISHNLDAAGYPMQLNVTSGTDIYSGWGANQAVTIPHPTAGRTWWHSGFAILPDGRIIGLIQDQLIGGSGSGGALYAAESLDGGLTFGVKVVYSDAGYYRPNITLYQSLTGEIGIYAWIGRLSGGYSIQREDWRQGAVVKALSDAATGLALRGTSSALSWYDNFNRADGAVGSPVIGSAFAVDVGSFTITSNQLVTVTAASVNRGLITVGSANHVIEATFAAVPSQSWLLFRVVDTSNLYRVGFPAAAPQALTIQSVVSGGLVLNRTVVPPSGTSNTPSIPVTVRVVARGRRFRIYVNEVLWEEITDNLYYATGVKAGIQGTNAGNAFDNLLVMP